MAVKTYVKNLFKMVFKIYLTLIQTELEIGLVDGNMFNFHFRSI